MIGEATMLSKSRLHFFVNGKKSIALSTNSFINEDFAHQLKLKVLPSSGSVFMASSTYCAQIKGTCLVDLSVDLSRPQR